MIFFCTTILYTLNDGQMGIPLIIPLCVFVYVVHDLMCLIYLWSDISVKDVSENFSLSFL